MKKSIRVGADVGGTFTDVALQVGNNEGQSELFTSKVLTDYSHPERAIVEGIEQAATQAGVALESIEQVIHGTTLVTNSLIERRGANLAFITTEGFRDVIEMRAENRFEQYDLNLQLPIPLVARQHRFTVSERVAADGSVLLSPSQADIDKLARQVVDAGYEAVAIGFMHSYANDMHERQMADAIEALKPELLVSLSSVVSPQMRELPRFNTVIANAYVQPQVADYLGRLVQQLESRGVGAPVFMLHSGGGLITVQTASEQPVRLLESGPAGGAIYAADFARAHGLHSVLSFDMGGTTAKICLIEEGYPKTANSFEVARTYRFKKGSGMTLSTPVVEMVEIGAGGGSIASIDAMGRIQVGPRSAASEPGPACYQRGGEEPTVTDANLLLGRLDPDNFAGGALLLSPSASETALQQKLCEATGFAVEEAAFGITEMVDENMANAARVHTVENGRDIERFTMIAFGGGAPLHACRLCEKLNIDSLLIPPGAGVGSAIGFLKAPFSYEATRGLFQRLAEFDIDAVRDTIAQLEYEALSFVNQGATGEPTTRSLTAFMRYSGQGWEIPVPLSDGDNDSLNVAAITEAFEQAYRTLFGRTIEGLGIEITNWSLMISTVLPEATRVERDTGCVDATVSGKREFFDAARRARVSAREVKREHMLAGVALEGPAVIVERETSTIVTSAYNAIGQADGSVLIQRKGASA